MGSAFSVCHVRIEDCPERITSGLAANVAVGAEGAGGGEGVTFATFLVQPANKSVTAVAKINGTFFNTGSGDPADDVGDSVFLYTDTNNPDTISVVNWFCSANGPCYGIELATYPVGTPLTVTNAWDKANHQFVSTVKAKWEPGPGKRAVLPYSVSDTTPPANVERDLNVTVTTPNCTSTRTFAGAEGWFDNVIVNPTP